MKQVSFLQFTDRLIKRTLFGLVTALACTAVYGGWLEEQLSKEQLSKEPSGVPLEKPLNPTAPSQVENIRIDCQNCNAIMSWDERGSADAYLVNFGDGKLHKTYETSITYPVTSSLANSAIEIQGVNKYHGRGNVTRFLMSHQHLASPPEDSTITNFEESCTRRGVSFRTVRNLSPITYWLSVGGYDFPEEVASGAVRKVVDMQDVPSTYDVSGAMTLILQWGCALTDSEEEERCPRETLTLVETVNCLDYINPYLYGPEKLTWGCLKEGVAGDLLLEAQWEHLFLYAVLDMTKTGDYIYHIETIDDNNVERSYTVPINLSSPEYDDQINPYTDFFSTNQSTTLTFQRGHSYQVSIMPDYVHSRLVDGLCESQTLTSNLTIPAKTEISQLDESRIGFQCSGSGSGCDIAVSVHDENESQESLAEITSELDADDENNIVITALNINQTYVAEIIHPANDSIPCRLDIVTFSLTPTPSPTIQPESIDMTTNVVYTAGVSQVQATVAEPGASSTEILPVITPEPGGVASTESGGVNTYIPLVAAGLPLGLISIVGITIVAGTYCHIACRHIKK